jgi:hypothetical protein
MEKKRNTQRILVVKSLGNGQLRRVRRRRKYNIKTDTEYVEWEGADFVKAVFNHQVLWNVGNFLTSWGTASFSRRPLLHEVSCCPSTRVRCSRFSSIGTECSNRRSNCLASKLNPALWQRAINSVLHSVTVLLQRNGFLFNNQPDAPIIQIYSVIKLYMFRASSLPIIRSSLLYIRHW